MLISLLRCCLFVFVADPTLTAEHGMTRSLGAPLVVGVARVTLVMVEIRCFGYLMSIIGIAG